MDAGFADLSEAERDRLARERFRELKASRDQTYYSRLIPNSYLPILNGKS